MKSLKVLSVGLLSLAVVVTSSPLTVAEVLCVPMVGCTDGGTNFTSFNVYFHNKSSSPVTVTVESWREPNNQGRSCLGGGTSCFSDGWRTGRWNFRPGEKALILDDVQGRNIYFSVVANDGSGSWPRKKVDMGSTYTRFEYSVSD